MSQSAKRLDIPRGTMRNIVERYRDAGAIEPRPTNVGRLASLDETGAKAYLPTHSPDFKRIEMICSTVKKFLPAAKARTPEGPWPAIAAALEEVAPEEIRHFSVTVAQA